MDLDHKCVPGLPSWRHSSNFSCRLRTFLVVEAPRVTADPRHLVKMSPMGEENVTPEWKSYDGKRLQGLISSEPNKWSSKEPVKMAPPSSEWRGPRSRQFDFQGNRLDKINWNGMEIVPVQKTFLVEHPNVKERTLEQCEKIRLENSIQILDDGGQEIPKPVEIFEETPFPDWATDVLRNKRYDKPTPIQVQAWPVILGGHDCVGIAETGLR